MAAGAITCESPVDSGKAFAGGSTSSDGSGAGSGSGRPLRVACRVPHHGNEQVGDAGRAHLTQCGKAVAIDLIEQHDAATEHLAFVDRLERPCCGGMLGLHHHFHIA